jgi:hypothetical protein
MHGREAYHLPGTRFQVWTRQDVWIHPVGWGVPVDATPETDLVLSAHAPKGVKFVPHKGRDPHDVEIFLDTESEPEEVVLYAVGEWGIPEPVSASSILRGAKGWICTFKGWDLLRYMRAEDEAGGILVTLHGKLVGGKTFTAEARVTVDLVEK